MLILLSLVASATSADYEVTIEGRNFLFSEGAEQQIIIDDGKQISIRIECIKTKIFQDHGISFSYPSEMKLNQDSFYGIKQITLEATDSTLLMIQVFQTGTTPDELQRDVLAGFQEVFGNLGARFPAHSTAICKRHIGGVERQGIELSYAFGDLALKNEIYTMQRADKTFAIVFQYAEEDKGKAMPRYDVVTKSFRYLSIKPELAP